jgi:hydroxymethylpyrimidine kinase/phosphomethylpyrimidine kinase/thiamine-phosphate diphosphorylase
LAPSGVGTVMNSQSFNKNPIVWTIAGSDPSGGAGIQADLKTFQSFNLQACSIISAITSQNNECVSHIHFIDKNSIISQIQSLEKKHTPRAIKIGMLGDANLFSLFSSLKKYDVPIILDPVIQSSSGYSLLRDQQENYLSALKKSLSSITLLTPNIHEAQLLTDRKIQSHHDVEQAANDLLSLGAKNILIKGGHFPDQQFSQDYWTNGEECFWLASYRSRDHETRGTGCTLSAAIAACLALGHTIKDAIVIGKMFINQCIRLANTNYLTYSTWPEQQIDLPFLSYNAIHTIPKKFLAPTMNDSHSLGLYPVVDSADWIEKLLSLGVNTIQLRVKNLSGDQLENEIKRSIHLSQKYSARLFINDYWELAIKHNAYGVHLGQEDLLTANIKKIQCAGLRLGISTHCYYEVAHAHYFQPSYIACGPIFPTTSKIMPFQAQGIAALQRWRRTLTYPLVAIGGINAECLDDVLQTDIDGVAMISAITKAKDWKAVTKCLLNKIEAARKYATLQTTN